MENIIKELKTKFDIISQKGYIKGIYNNSASIGRTLENELGLSLNKNSVPDYKGIEIKTRRIYSKSYITLINAIPDGSKPKEVERIKNAYGYPYKKNKKYKVLYFDAYGNKLSPGGCKYRYKLKIDRIKEKIQLQIYNRNEYLIEEDAYWSFEYLENKILNKIRYLAIINAWPITRNGWNYFKYSKITFYEFICFEKFIELIENGIIRLNFKVGIYTDEANYGKTYDHGCGFEIQEKDIEKLFKRIII